MKSCALLVLLLLSMPGCSKHGGQTPATVGKTAQVRMEYRDFAQVQSFRNPSAPLQAVTSQVNGGQMTFFLVAAP